MQSLEGWRTEPRGENEHRLKTDDIRYNDTLHVYTVIACVVVFFLRDPNVRYHFKAGATTHTFGKSTTLDTWRGQKRLTAYCTSSEFPENISSSVSGLMMNTSWSFSWVTTFGISTVHIRFHTGTCTAHSCTCTCTCHVQLYELFRVKIGQHDLTIVFVLLPCMRVCRPRHKQSRCQHFLEGQRFQSKTTLDQGQHGSKAQCRSPVETRGWVRSAWKVSMERGMGQHWMLSQNSGLSILPASSTDAKRNILQPGVWLNISVTIGNSTNSYVILPFHDGFLSPLFDGKSVFHRESWPFSKLLYFPRVCPFCSK